MEVQKTNKGLSQMRPPIHTTRTNAFAHSGVAFALALLCNCTETPDPPPPPKVPDSITDTAVDLTGIVFSQSPFNLGDIGFSSGDFEAQKSKCYAYFESSYEAKEDKSETPLAPFEFVSIKNSKIQANGAYGAVKAKFSLEESSNYRIKLTPKEAYTRKSKSAENKFEDCLTWNSPLLGNPRDGIFRDAVVVERGTASVEAFSLVAVAADFSAGTAIVEYAGAKYEQKAQASASNEIYFARWRRTLPVKPISPEDIYTDLPSYLLAYGPGKGLGQFRWNLQRAHDTTAISIRERDGLYVTLSGEPIAAPSDGPRSVQFSCSSEASCEGKFYIHQVADSGFIQPLSLIISIGDSYGTFFDIEKPIVMIESSQGPS